MEPSCTDWSVTLLPAWISSDSRAGCCSSIHEEPAPARAASTSSFRFECWWGLGTKPRVAAEVSPPAGNLCPSPCPLSLALWMGSLSIPKVQAGLVPCSLNHILESPGMDFSRYQRALLSKRLTEQDGKSSTANLLGFWWFLNRRNVVGLERSFPHILKTGKSWSRRSKGKPSGTQPLKVVIP